MNRRNFLRSCTAAALITAIPGTLRAQQAGHPAAILPYLQNPTADAITICFLAQNAQDVKVKIEAAQKGLSGQRIQEAKPTPIPGTPWTIWKTRCAQLLPGKNYAYTVTYTQDDKTATTETYTFTHLDPKAATIRAIALNDIHDRLPTLEKVMENIKPGDYDLSLINGDMWNDPSPRDGAQRVFQTMEGYVRLLSASTKPMFYIRGNHDTRGSFANRLSYLFDLPNNNPASPLHEQNAYHDFRCGPIWFIAPDAGEDGSKRPEVFQPYRQRQVPWLEALFAQSPNRDAPWRIITLHIPLYNTSWWDQPDALNRWEPVLRNAKIDLMIAGHDHSWRFLEKGKTYTRTKKDKEGNQIKNEVKPPYPVLIGGGPAIGGGEIATAILIKAQARTLTARMIDANGKTLTTLSRTK